MDLCQEPSWGKVKEEGAPEVRTDRKAAPPGEGAGSLEGKTLWGGEGRQAPPRIRSTAVGLAEDLWLTPPRWLLGTLDP